MFRIKVKITHEFQLDVEEQHYSDRSHNAIMTAEAEQLLQDREYLVDILDSEVVETTVEVQEDDTISQ